MPIDVSIQSGRRTLRQRVHEVHHGAWSKLGGLPACTETPHTNTQSMPRMKAMHAHDVAALPRAPPLPPMRQLTARVQKLHGEGGTASTLAEGWEMAGNAAYPSCILAGGHEDDETGLGRSAPATPAPAWVPCLWRRSEAFLLGSHRHTAMVIQPIAAPPPRLHGA